MQKENEVNVNKQENVENNEVFKDVAGGKFVAGKEKFDKSKPHVIIGDIKNVDHGKTTLTAGITTSLAKEKFDEELLHNVAGGNIKDNNSYFIDCVDAIDGRRALDAWEIYHNHFNEMGVSEKEVLKEMYQEAFQRNIDDSMPPFDFD